MEERFPHRVHAIWPTAKIQILTLAHDHPIDLRTPFSALTMALVFASTVSVLRMMVAGPVKWAELVALATLLCWRYWARATGLLAWRFRWPAIRFRHFSFLQSLLNGFTYLTFAEVVFSWPGNSLKKSTWLAAAVLGFAIALILEEHSDFDPSQRA
jgi:hypothetical protein